MKMVVSSADIGCSPNNREVYYSAPSSPAKGGGDDFSTPPRFDDFEFETSKNFDDKNVFECFLEVEEGKPKKIRERGGDSLPTMAFADELFVNGLVMPLKLKPPPRLQAQTIRGNSPQQYCSVPSSPTSGFKNLFVRRVAWNDDFDPFAVALQKVSEENRGRSSSTAAASGHHHRRTRSHSPFRMNQYFSEHHHHHNYRCNGYSETIKINPGRSHLNSVSQEQQLKGSPYARWVLDHQTNQLQQLSPKGKNMLKGFTFVKSRVRPVKSDHHDNAMAEASIGQKNGHQDNGETKMKRIKGILQKYASFRKENGEDKSTNQNSKRRWGSSYLKKLSFKIKGNTSDDETRKKRAAAIMEEPKIAVVEYKRNKPTIALCFYGIESPSKQLKQ